jgi:hypothetical protein
LSLNAYAFLWRKPGTRNEGSFVMKNHGWKNMIGPFFGFKIFS